METEPITSKYTEQRIVEEILLIFQNSILYLRRNYKLIQKGEKIIDKAIL